MSGVGTHERERGGGAAKIFGAIGEREGIVVWDIQKRGRGGECSFFFWC